MSGTECTICCVSLFVGAPCRLPCGHCFHRECVLYWLAEGAAAKTCPLCKAFGITQSNIVELKLWTGKRDGRNLQEIIEDMTDKKQMLMTLQSEQPDLEVKLQKSRLELKQAKDQLDPIQLKTSSLKQLNDELLIVYERTAERKNEVTRRLKNIVSNQDMDADIGGLSLQCLRRVEPSGYHREAARLAVQQRKVDELIKKVLRMVQTHVDKLNGSTRRTEAEIHRSVRRLAEEKKRLEEELGGSSNREPKRLRKDLGVFEPSKALTLKENSMLRLSTETVPELGRKLTLDGSHAAPAVPRRTSLGKLDELMLALDDVSQEEDDQPVFEDEEDVIDID